MSKSLLSKQKHPKGFTLIELMITIVILGTLIAVTAPQLIKSFTETHNTDRGGVAKAVVSAINNNSSLGGYQSCYAGNMKFGGAALTRDASAPGYIPEEKLKEIGTDPKTKAPIKYSCVVFPNISQAGFATEANGGVALVRPKSLPSLPASGITVNTGDDDIGITVAAVTAGDHFMVTGANGLQDSGEAVYINFAGTATGVTAGDYRLNTVSITSGDSTKTLPVGLVIAGDLDIGTAYTAAATVAGIGELLIWKNPDFTWATPTAANIATVRQNFALYADNDAVASTAVAASMRRLVIPSVLTGVHRNGTTGTGYAVDGNYFLPTTNPATYTAQ